MFLRVSICSLSPLSGIKIHSERCSTLSQLNQTTISHHTVIQGYFSTESLSYYIHFIVEEICSSFGLKMVLSTWSQHLLSEIANAQFSKKFSVIILLWGNMQIKTKEQSRQGLMLVIFNHMSQAFPKTPPSDPSSHECPMSRRHHAQARTSTQSLSLSYSSINAGSQR